jgi:hypothetical protein
MGAAVFPTLARRFVATDDGTVTDARGVVTFVPAFGFGVVLLGSVVVVVGGGTEVTVTTVEESLGEVAAVDGTVAGVDFAADALVIRRNKGVPALFAAATLLRPTIKAPVREATEVVCECEAEALPPVLP